MKKEPLQNLKQRIVRCILAILALLTMPAGMWAEDYNLWVSGEQVTSDNMNSVAEGQFGEGRITFDGNHTLTFTNLPYISTQSPFIQTNMDLTIHLVGTSELDTGECLIKRIDGDNNTHTLTFTTDENNPGILLLHYGISHEGFEVVCNNGLNWNASGYFDNPAETDAWIAQPSLGLKVAGTVVTAGNANNILGDELKTCSYDNTSHTLTLKGANISTSSSAIIVGEDISALIIHLVGNSVVYSNNDPIISFANANPSLTFTTSEILPGSLGATNLATGINPVYQNGLTYSDGTISALLSKTTVELFTGRETYVNTDNGDNSYIYSTSGFYATYATNVDGSSHFVKVSTKENETTAAMWPSSLSNSQLIEKVTLQLGACTNNNVTVQVIGLNNEGSADGKTYSNAIALSTADADGIIEIPIENVTSDNLQLVFSSTSSFSFLPMSIAFTEAPVKIGGGTGTSDNPFLIKTASDLNTLSNYINNGTVGNDVFVQLYQDIDCSDLEGFEPIGTPKLPFVGTFSGSKGDNSGNYKISNLTYDAAGDESDYAGLFYVIGSDDNPGSVSNLTLENCTFQNGIERNGAIAGMLSNGSIENCNVTSCYILSDAQAPSCGGIVGSLYGGSITNCTVDGSTITATSETGSLAGGIVAFITGTATVSGCQVTGTDAKPTIITGSSNYYDSTNFLGGIVGNCSLINEDVISISNNKVLGNTTISSVENNADGGTCAGAIIGDKDAASLAGNTYEYTVTTSVQDGEAANAVIRDGYMTRGIGADQDTSEEGENFDVTSNNGAVMYTQKLTIVGLGDHCGIEGVDGYAPLTDPENHSYYFAPGQETTIYLYPDATYEASVSLTYSETSTTINKNAEEEGYKFTMPDAEATLNVTLTAKPSIWIGGIEMNASGAFPDIPTASYNAETNTLTLDNSELTTEMGNVIEFGIEGLKVHLKGENIITCNDQEGAAFKSLLENNTIVFSAENDESKLTMATMTPYSNLTASYNGKLVYVAGESNKFVMPIEAPSLYIADGILIMNAELLPEGAQFFYAIDYADESLADVELTSVAPEENQYLGPEVLGPCTITAYTKAGTAQSTTVTAKLFGFAQTAVRGTVGSEEGVEIPAVIPAIAEADGLTVSYTSENEDVVTVSDGMIIIGSTIGSTAIYGNLQMGTTAPSYEILNSDGVLENLTVYVVPAAPTFDSGTGNYEIAQLVEISNPNTLEGYTTKIFYQIDNGDITEYTEDTKPYISQSAKLLAWIDVYDANNALLAPLRSNTTEATYTIAENYNLYVGGVLVHEWNKDDIFGEGDGEGATASFDPGTNTLTLNGATIATESGNGIDSYIDELTIHLVGNSTMNHQIWMSNGAKKLKFTTSDETPGKLAFASDVTNPYEASGVSSWSNATYQNGLTLRKNADNAYVIALEMPTPKLTNSTGKIYFPDATFALTIESDNAADFDIYYSIGTGEATKYTEPFTIEGTANATINAYCIYRQYADDSDYKSNTPSYYIRRVDKPTFTPAGGTYDEAQAVKLENLPENLSANTYPQVWYYLGENPSDSIKYTAATQEINVESSTKVCVYFLDEDSGKLYKSDPVESQYIIRQDAGLVYLQNQEPVEVVDYTIGGDENPALPVLQNENNLTITYTSSNTAVATVNATTGVVTPVGVGETTITATSEQTDVLQAGEASYMLRVYKDLSHESISVTVADATFTGEEVTPEVTVMDGETDITKYVTVTYSNNVNVGQGTVTVTANDQLETNFYVGETTQTFTIVNRTLRVGEDVAFADGQTWATFYTTAETLELPEGINAYVVTAINGTALTLQAISQVPKNVPVLLEQSETPAETNDSYDRNLLRGTSAATSVASISSGTVYVLYKNNFVKSISGSIPAGRAYLVLEGTSAAGAPSMLFFGDETLGIRLAGLDEVPNDAVWYTLEGRKLQGKPTKKGLYILNGKKIVVK